LENELNLVAFNEEKAIFGCTGNVISDRRDPKNY
jgi:hypothetical protein